MLSMPSTDAVPPDGVPLYDSDQSAAALHMHPQTFRRLCRQGLLPARKIGGRWYMSHEDLMRTKLGLPHEGATWQ